MKFVCTFREPGGALVTFQFEAESKLDALNGLLQRCEERVNINPGAYVERLIVWPEVLVYEDMTFDTLGRGPSGDKRINGDVAVITTNATMEVPE